MQQGKAHLPSPRLVIAALIAVQVLFGINYVVSKVVVDAFPPLVWAGIRIVIASAFMLGTALASGHSHPKDGKKFFGPLVIFALLGIIINQSSFLVGLHHTTATNSAVLNTLIPVFTLLIVTLRGQEPLTLKRGLGFVSALAGVLLIRRIEEISFNNDTWIGDLLTVLNCLSYACFLSFSKKFLEAHDRLWTTTWLFLYGSVGLNLLALPDWTTFLWPAMSPYLVGCMMFAVLGGTLLTYFLNIWALAYARSSSVALFIYVQPIVASLLAWVWMGQVPTARTFVCSGLIFVGMILGLRGGVTGSASGPKSGSGPSVPSKPEPVPAKVT